MGGDSTSRLSREQLSRILRIGTSDADTGAGSDVPQTVDEWLQDLLAAGFRKGASGDGYTVRDVLFGPPVEADVFREIKDWAKAIAARAGQGPAHVAATTIYYAAIARALVSANEKVTEHGPEGLRQAFAMLTAKQWMPPDFHSLFGEARELCRASSQ